MQGNGTLLCPRGRGVNDHLPPAVGACHHFVVGRVTGVTANQYANTAGA